MTLLAWAGSNQDASGSEQFSSFPAQRPRFRSSRLPSKHCRLTSLYRIRAQTQRTLYGDQVALIFPQRTILFTTMTLIRIPFKLTFSYPRITQFDAHCIECARLAQPENFSFPARRISWNPNFFIETFLAKWEWCVKMGSDSDNPNPLPSRRPSNRTFVPH